MDTIDLAKEMFEDQSFPMYQIEDFVKILTKADELYHSSDDESFLTDTEYDMLRRYAEKVDPTDPYFLGIGSEIRGEKVKLPYPMGSLDQVYEGEIPNWVVKHALGDELTVISDKLDGQSGMVIYDKKGEFQIAYSRGDGVEGADISRHICNLRTVPTNVTKPLTVRGEIIIEEATFPFVRDNFKRKGGKPYKNPRNAVAGMMNSKTIDKGVYNYIKFVAYQIVGSDESKDVQLRDLEAMGFEVVYSTTCRGKNLSDEWLTKHLELRKQNSVYEIDGLVVDVNGANKRAEMNPTRDTLNPAYSIKYKVTDKDNIAFPMVIDVEWNVSKHGYLKPRVNIDPVELGGVTITYATGFNAAFIREHGIGPGAIIQLTRSGDVIPFIQRVVESTVPAMPQQFDWDWSWTVNAAGVEVDAVLNNPEVSEVAQVKRMVDFFDKIDAPMLKMGNVQKMYDADYRTIASIILAPRMAFTKVLGKNGNKIFYGLEEKLSNIPLYKIMGAYSTERGIGVRRMKKLQVALGRDDLYSCNDETVFASVEGFDEITGRQAVKVVSNFIDFFAEVKDFVTIAEEEKVGTSFAGEKVCLTGFRDKELQAQIESMGGTVQSSVSGKTTILVAKDPNSNTGKPKKARDLGIPIMGVDEFKEHIGA